ncbi:MAG TPA: hypothetical protein ENJ37_05085 [Deltaproteobacteria bacterium]|nr:hypothetical protein [Deltaproteobacteria bacterium]
MEQHKAAQRRSAAPVLVGAAALAAFALLSRGLITGDEIFTHDSLLSYGPFHYALDAMSEGIVPLWDPYSITGLPFYPNLNFSSLIDPLILPFIPLARLSGPDFVLWYVHFWLVKLLVFALGAYLLFSRVAGSRAAGAAGAGVLLLAVAPVSFRQLGVICAVYLTPMVMYLLLRLFDPGTRRQTRLRLALFVLTAGVSLNLFIPVYFLFNIVFYAAALVVAGAVKWREGLARFRGEDGPGLLFLLFVLAAAVMICGPLLALYIDSSGGEIFPHIRILQKNGWVYKQMMASELAGDVLSHKFTRSLGVYSSLGNLVNLVYPDMFRSYFARADYFRMNDLTSEVFQYMGIVPFVLALAALVRSRSPHRLAALLMVVITGVNMISLEGVHDRAPNVVQRLFSAVFPPLEMIDVKEQFGGFFLLYLSMLFSLGVRPLFEGRDLGAAARSLLRPVLVASAAVLAFKLAVSWACFGRLLFVSGLDLLCLAVLAAFCALLVLFAGTGKERRRPLFTVLLTAFLFIDLTAAGAAMKRYVVQPNTLSPVLKKHARKGSFGEDFELYRIPFMDVSLVYAEAVFKRKSSIAPGGVHRQMFTTKRYYDLLTNVPLEKHFALTGIVYPLLRFVPAGDAELVPGRREAFSAVREATIEELGRKVFIEKDGAAGGPAADFKSLDEFPDAPWLMAVNVKRAYRRFLEREKALVEGARRRAGDYIETDRFGVRLLEFTPNTAVFGVRSRVDGYLYYNDGWSRYWRATVDGREAELLVADYNSKAVALSAGEHTVRLVYDPLHYRLGLFAYLAAIAALLGVVLLNTRR